MNELCRRLELCGVGLSVEPPGNVVQVRTDIDSTFSGVKSRGHAKPSGNPKRLSVVTGAVTTALARFDAKGISLTASVGDPLGQVLVDPDRMAEALGSLLDNALRHTAKGGAVTVATTRHDSRCRIAVTDSGDGFDPAQANQLFERFYRGDSSRTANGTGSGIGLTIAKAIIKAHHGQLVGHSDGPGTGAQFEITLPIAARHR